MSEVSLQLLSFIYSHKLSRDHPAKRHWEFDNDYELETRHLPLCILYSNGDRQKLNKQINKVISGSDKCCI
jgi:hypothetical protein